MRICLIVAIIFNSFNSFCQKIVEINYVNLPDAGCNVLANHRLIGGYTHQTISAVPKPGVVSQCISFDAIMLLNSGIYTSQTTGQQNLKVTSYSIKFPFRQNLRYKISCLARTFAFNGTKANVGLAFSTTEGDTYNGCGNEYYPLSILDKYIYQSELDYADCDVEFHWVNPVSTVLNQQYDYLFVAGIRNNLYDGETYACIQKIKIEEIPIILPANSDIICGSSTPITFTIPNTGTPVSISNYKWNLGSSSNGWSHNGAPAPQFINTSTNTLILTPSCGMQQSINAVVTSNGINYNSDPAIITMKPAAMSISGSTIVKDHENYFIQSLPCQAAVTWSISPAGILNLTNQNNSSVTATRIIDGFATLSATITSCGQTTTINKQISSCANISDIASSLTATPSWPNSSYYGYTLSFTPVANASSYTMEWYDLTDNKLFMRYSINGPGEFVYTFINGHTYQYRVAAVAFCGSNGVFSAWSSALLPPPPVASCSNGPLSTTLSQTLGCGGSPCNYTTLSWPSISGASNYKIEYQISNIGGGLSGSSGINTTTSTSFPVFYSYLSGTGWTIKYRVAASCGGVFGNFSDWSSNFFLQ